MKSVSFATYISATTHQLQNKKEKSIWNVTQNLFMFQEHFILLPKVGADITRSTLLWLKGRMIGPWVKESIKKITMGLIPSRLSWNSLKHCHHTVLLSSKYFIVTFSYISVLFFIHMEVFWCCWIWSKFVFGKLRKIKHGSCLPLDWWRILPLKAAWRTNIWLVSQTRDFSSLFLAVSASDLFCTLTRRKCKGETWKTKLDT